MRRIVISDIHGCEQTFRALLKKIKLEKSDLLFLGGDYIDRGPSSKGVLDTIIELREQGYQLRCIKGNHEIMMQTARNDDHLYNQWSYNGGYQTMRSFGVQNINAISDKYWKFLEQLNHYIEDDAYIFVHAGLNFECEDPFEDDHAMLWIRDWYPKIDYSWLGNRTIIHGHTPVTKQEIKRGLSHLDQMRVLNIDCGCFLTVDADRGKLCALDLTNMHLHFQNNIDDMSGYF